MKKCGNIPFITHTVEKDKVTDTVIILEAMVESQQKVVVFLTLNSR